MHPLTKFSLISNLRATLIILLLQSALYVLCTVLSQYSRIHTMQNKEEGLVVVP